MGLSSCSFTASVFFPDIKVEHLNPRLKSLGELYVHGRDKGSILQNFFGRVFHSHIEGKFSPLTCLEKFAIILSNSRGILRHFKVV
jgi:hypothetical protein